MNTVYSDKYGFKMDVPEGTKMLTVENAKKGWGGLYAKVGDVHLIGFAKLGKKHGARAIESFGINYTKIARKHWEPLGSGRNKQGFKWYRAAIAQSGDHALVAIYGVGKRGSYLLLLKSTKTDFANNMAAYKRWVDSIRLF